MINGIDVSSVQGHVDWQAVAASGIQFAFVKCFTGNDGVDPFYDTNVTNALAAGLYVGSYFFVYPLPDAPGHVNRDPVGQAQLHFSHCKTPIFAADLEWPAPGPDWAKWGIDGSFLNDWCLKYLETFTSLAGSQPLVYTYPYWAAAVQFRQDFAQYKLWVASYEPEPAVIQPWGKDNWVVWQTTGGGGKLPNGAPVDTNVMRDLSLFGA